MRGTEAERFWAKVDLTGDCWLWTACQSGKGYGSFAVGNRRLGTYRMVPAHRWAYEHMVGPIPDGLVIDHLCRVHGCVNPDHLEPVTNRENTVRGDRDAMGAHERAKTHCPKGHAYDEANTFTYRGSRFCRACDRDRKRAARLGGY